MYMKQKILTLAKKCGLDSVEVVIGLFCGLAFICSIVEFYVNLILKMN